MHSSYIVPANTADACICIIRSFLGIFMVHMHSSSIFPANTADACTFSHKHSSIHVPTDLSRKRSRCMSIFSPAISSKHSRARSSACIFLQTLYSQLRSACTTSHTSPSKHINTCTSHHISPASIAARIFSQTFASQLRSACPYSYYISPSKLY